MAKRLRGILVAVYCLSERAQEDDVERVRIAGEEFECNAAPYPWPHGVGVRIDIASSDKRVGSVHVVCAKGHAGFDALAALSPREVCDLALSRFVAGHLPVTLEHVLRWQKELGAMGFDYVSPLGSSWLPRIHCSITFLPTSEGGRSKPFPAGALSGDTYRPHLVVGDIRQREAVIVDGQGDEEYIGVAFCAGPLDVPFGTEIRAALTLIYSPHPMYDGLKPGTTFTVREGSHIVGYGTVLR
jgi:hypothetical protein